MTEQLSKRLPFLTRLRPYQEDLINVVEERKIRRFYCLWSARSGKDMTCLYIVVLRALNTPGGVFGYFFPTKEQARRIVVDGRLEDGRSLLSVIPEEEIKEFNKSTLAITLRNNAKIQFLPSDRGKGDAAAGESWSGVVLSEFALMMYGDRLLDVLTPRLKKEESFLIINTTPRGSIGTGFEEWKKHKLSAENYYASMVTVGDIFKQEYIEKIIREQGLDEFQVRRELYCDFHAPVQHSIYGDILNSIKLEEVFLPNNNNYVFVGMDLGFKRDATAWWAFVKSEGKYYFTDFKIIFFGNLFDIISDITSRFEHPYFFLPHDGDKGGGSGVADRFRELNLNYEVLPRAYSVEEEIKGIVRPFLKRKSVVFKDCKEVESGLEYLKAYRRTDNGLIYHGTDGASDAADAFRYSLVGAYRYLESNCVGLKKRLNDSKFR